MYNFETAFAEADAVARIKVGDWLAETEHVTYYEAAVLQCFKGDMPDIFTLIQDGCSDHTLDRYPLFTWGDEMLLFLDIAKDDEDLEFNSPYWIIGAFTTIFDVAYDKDGNRYYVDSYGVIGERTDIEKNYSDDAKVYESVYSWMCAANPLMAEAEEYHIPYIFSDSDVLKLIDEY